MGVKVTVSTYLFIGMWVIVEGYRDLLFFPLKIGFDF
jgi:hypothetical protein